jgi:hypothetical protein
VGCHDIAYSGKLSVAVRFSDGQADICVSAFHDFLDCQSQRQHQSPRRINPLKRVCNLLSKPPVNRLPRKVFHQIAKFLRQLRNFWSCYKIRAGRPAVDSDSTLPCLELFREPVACEVLTLRPYQSHRCLRKVSKKPGHFPRTCSDGKIFSWLGRPEQNFYQYPLRLYRTSGLENPAAG